MTYNHSIMKSIEFKRGKAWIIKASYPLGKAFKIEWLEKDPDGVIREKWRIDIVYSYTTGDCDKCHQMPCNHTAKLMGWTK